MTISNSMNVNARTLLAITILNTGMHDGFRLTARTIRTVRTNLRFASCLVAPFSATEPPRPPALDQ